MTAPALLDVRNGIALVTINRPEMRNAIDLATAKRIAEIVDEIDSRTDIAVVIVRGAGSGFCSGLDLKAYARGEIGRIEGRGFAGFNEKPPTKPVIAAVEGFALAGGFELAITCDLIVIASDAKVGLPEVRRGLVPTAGGLLRLPRLLPPKIANELILTGRIVTAKELIGYGLFNSVVSPGAAADEARRLAAEMVANAPEVA